MVGRYSYSVEVPLLNFTAQSSNKFDDAAANSILNPANKPGLIVAITAIETYYSGLYSKSTSQRPIISQLDATKLAVTLRVGNVEPIYQAPYLSYCTLLNYGMRRNIVPTPINLSKSEVIIQDALANNSFSAIFNFWYDVFTVSEWKLVMDSIRNKQINLPSKKQRLSDEL